MKILALVLILATMKVHAPDDSLISMCKHGNNIKIEYIHSIESIYNVKSNVKGDTLTLNVYVSTSANLKSFEVPVPPKVRFLKYGKTVKEIAKLDECSSAKVLSGKEALDYLKKL
ncbi:hypothetical protein IDJ77_08255 [Mucilaginibacter sp. ZT4R22]|uniref:Uncharacterized protein n=1 Tax=Mucilaginibacter pankratovii TaxID=2772110 RepID=A0ABR7WNP9_9SPHI|nr:hypothetical protein [Mucilaginibacter pankratovii]MBD1363801.1 hypothetical protein [Mucilaginibacter pankratovii]